MQLLQINLENGRFVSSNGKADILEPDMVIGLGWTCTITERGDIYCCSHEEQPDGIHKAEFMLCRNGFSQLTGHVNETVYRLKKCFVVPKGQVLQDGVLSLSGGPIDQRYGYFRDRRFLEYLEKRKISKVTHADPNRTYQLGNHMQLISDGLLFQKTGQVQGASWVVVYAVLRGHINGVLYTLEHDIFNLKGIPECD